MNIGVPKETVADERRVALTPDVAGRLGKSGLAVLVERAAGEAASFGDAAYQAAGATVVPAAADLFGQSDVILKVQMEDVRSVEEFEQKLRDRTNQGQRNALIFAKNASGTPRWVTLPLRL